MLPEVKRFLEIHDYDCEDVIDPATLDSEELINNYMDINESFDVSLYRETIDKHKELMGMAGLIKN